MNPGLVVHAGNNILHGFEFYAEAAGYFFVGKASFCQGEYLGFPL
jgi:hypothetical protein